uniref:Uncharacterized protein n=2 Tax=Rhinopithecus bieti TaxID=61621 RepID=A0A2K6JXZ3_RHIBE
MLPSQGCQQHPTQHSTHHLTRPSPWPEEQPCHTPQASLLTTRWLPEHAPASPAWCEGMVPYAPCVLCVSCLYMWLPLMLMRWGTILARVGWDQTFFSSSPEIMLTKISSQRMGWGAPCEVAPERWGALQGISGVLFQLTLG